MVSSRLNPKSQDPNPKSKCGHCLGFRTWVLAFGIWVLGFVLALSAQGRGGARGAAGAETSQLRQVLYDMADSIGMLRNANEVDRIGSMNYWATGTIASGGQTCKVVDYKASVNWILKGMRVDYKCEGSPQRHVEVVKDNLAWNETEPGKGGTLAAAMASERAPRRCSSVSRSGCRTTTSTRWRTPWRSRT